MLDFLRSLTDLSALQSMPWRWWVSLSLGLAGMIAILMHVRGDLAVLYIFLDLVASVVLGAAWQWRAESKARRRGCG